MKENKNTLLIPYILLKKDIVKMDCANLYYFYSQIRNIFVDFYKERNTLLRDVMKFYYDYPLVLFMLFTMVFMIRTSSKMMQYDTILKSQILKNKKMNDSFYQMERQLKKCTTIIERIFQDEEYQKDREVVVKMKNMKSIIDQMLFIIYESKSMDIENRIEKLMDNLSTYKLNAKYVK
jgi:hypothetical protein